jgi:hypothetical protein
MTIDFALDHIPRRMRELGFEDAYYTKFKHLVMSPSETRKIEGYNQYWMLIDEPGDVSIVSEFGVFDLTLINANELDHEHQGLITITNYLAGVNHVRFIQVIPKHNGTNN